MQGCRLARLFGKSIRDFYARNQYFLMNTQPKQVGFLSPVSPFEYKKRRYQKITPKFM